MVSKVCPICTSDVSSLVKTPASSSGKHSLQERACNECWEAHLSTEVEEKDPRKVECMYCSSVIDRSELSRLARKGTLKRYDGKMEDATHRRCQNRCETSEDDEPQDHDRDVNGRVFACRFCDFRTCVACDHPEHDGETCEEYRTRVVFDQKHIIDEFDTSAAYKRCPGCEVVIEWEKGCGYTQCTACQYRFCSRCLITWVGENSAYLDGKEGHFEGCLYRTRDAGSLRRLKRRFQPDEETQKRLDEKKDAKKQKRQGKKEADAVERDARIGGISSE